MVDPTGHQTLTGTQFAMGDFNLALAVDPTNPNIRYLGGTHQYQATGLIRIDITGLADPHAFYLSNSDAGGGLMTSAAGPVSEVTPTNGPPLITPPYSPVVNPTLNLLVDPNKQFAANSTLLVTNTKGFSNTGGDVTWVPFDQALAPDPFGLQGSTQPTRGLHQIITLVDPLTGKTRLIFGDDQGVYTAVDAGDTTGDGMEADDGALLGSVGGLTVGTPGALDTPFGETPIVNGSRNGNLQIAQMLSASSQPSTAASQLASVIGALYGATVGTGLPSSNTNTVNAAAIGQGYGDISWENGIDRYTGTEVATDPTGTGTVYQFILPSSLADEIHDLGIAQGVTDFFQVNGVSQTLGLIQAANGGDIPDPEWPFNTGSNFTVNPIDGQPDPDQLAGRHDLPHGERRQFLGDHRRPQRTSTIRTPRRSPSAPPTPTGPAASATSTTSCTPARRPARWAAPSTSPRPAAAATAASATTGRTRRPRPFRQRRHDPLQPARRLGHLADRRQSASRQP